MTRAHEKELCAFITEALELRHLLNCAAHSDMPPEDWEECLAYKTLSDLCMRFAYVLRRKVWKAWEEQRQEERKRKRAALKRRQEKRKQREEERKRERQQAR